MKILLDATGQAQILCGMYLKRCYGCLVMYCLLVHSKHIECRLWRINFKKSSWKERQKSLLTAQQRFALLCYSWNLVCLGSWFYSVKALYDGSNIGHMPSGFFILFCRRYTQQHVFVGYMTLLLLEIPLLFNYVLGKATVSFLLWCHKLPPATGVITIVG